MKKQLHERLLKPIIEDQKNEAKHAHGLLGPGAPEHVNPFWSEKAQSEAAYDPTKGMPLPW